MADITKTTETKSNQLNSDDMKDDMVINITKVDVKDNGDQPVSVFFEGDNGKPWKPCKTMRKVLKGVWGKETDNYIGGSIKLYVDPRVKFGKEEVGGIRIKAMSRIEKKVSLALITASGRKSIFLIEPLMIPEPKPEPKPERTLDERKEACKAALKTAGFELTEDDLESLSEIDNAKSLAEFFNSFKKEEA
jgi:hypothetical protein